jgi:hypothetical protein
MPTGSSQKVVSIGGVTFTAGSGTVDKDHANVYGDGTGEIVLAAGIAVTGWDNLTTTTANATLPAGHGYTTGKIDVAWTTGGGGRRYNVDATITVNALALAGGTGDNYPADGDATVVVCAPQTINTAIDGDAVGLYVANSTVLAQLLFLDSGGAVISHRDLAANTVDDWYSGNGVANPFTGNPIVVCYASNETTTAGILFIGTLEDSTP